MAVSKLKRVEHYVSPHSIGHSVYIFRLEDDTGAVVRIVSDNFAQPDLIRLAQALQRIVAASPGGSKKDFVVLDYIQGRFRF